MTDIRLTPKQERHLDRLNRAPWKWFCSDDKYNAIVERYEAESQRRNFATIARVTTYDGPDFRIRLEGQRTWIRASALQYEQAEYVGIERSIGVPAAELVAA